MNKLIEQAKYFLAEEKAQSDWGSVYMLLVLIIAALILITVIKPMFTQSQEVVATTKDSLQTPN